MVSIVNEATWPPHLLPWEHNCGILPCWFLVGLHRALIVFLRCSPFQPSKLQRKLSPTKKNRGGGDDGGNKTQFDSLRFVAWLSLFALAAGAQGVRYQRGCHSVNQGRTCGES